VCRRGSTTDYWGCILHNLQECDLSLAGTMYVYIFCVFVSGTLNWCGPPYRRVSFLFCQKSKSKTVALQSEITVYIIQSTMNKQNQTIQLKTNFALGLSVWQSRASSSEASALVLVFNCNPDITVLGVSRVKQSVSILNLKRAYSSGCSSRSGNVTLTNEVRVRQDMLRELMVPVVQSSPKPESTGGGSYGKFSA